MSQFPQVSENTSLETFLHSSKNEFMKSRNVFSRKSNKESCLRYDRRLVLACIET